MPTSSLAVSMGYEMHSKLEPQQIVDEVKTSGLRGRGGAAFPTGIKWQTVLDTPAEQKFICCNADEGDSGTFADRLLMEADPYQLLEGMIIAGLAVGADQGYIYLRSEYPRAYAGAEPGPGHGRSGRRPRRQTCWVVAGASSSKLRLGANAYVCGEETSMLESLEGKRGLVRFKPPLPAIEGLFRLPTVVNNVLSLAAVSTILAGGGAAYAALGEGRSRGTLTVQLGGNIRRGGLVEVPFGTALSILLEDFGGGTASGRPMRAVQVGGPLGTYLPAGLMGHRAGLRGLQRRGRHAWPWRRGGV